MSIPRLVASDIDGTLLDPLEQIRPRTAAVVHRLQAADVPFILATGRAPRFVIPVSRMLDAPGLAVCINGAVVFDTRSEQVRSMHTLDAVLLNDVGEALLRLLPGCTLAVERIKTTGTGLNDEFLGGPGYVHPWSTESLIQSATIAEILGRPAVRLMARHDSLSSDEMAAAVTTMLGDVVEVAYSTDLGLIDVMPSGISKASGLAEITEDLGISAAEVIAFGDMPNDLPMLRWVGHGVAMGNAHPEVRDIADEVTVSNAEDGVAHVLERWF
ncbi:HAD family hydrolase [Actinoalloteichus hymeniacidonis]|uniref:HAD-superfamily hydrolase, subfamily IIB n=1 Tax=Actinoalloteichus hymeniacidonis TaxID=340345 RepID=A0AAC9HL94_9PSEU|nr:HAD family hydrolase [Actinoalloteichus hymeniacidonis]AOS60980.1 HAD-superfamily hydrolase, subfamily IIB [Actinoalloteichus hymeniacidonis]MBB5911020.1 hypothetical protein [Actinoalloteichus hymeniacidonis]